MPVNGVALHRSNGVLPALQEGPQGDQDIVDAPLAPLRMLPVETAASQACQAVADRKETIPTMIGFAMDHFRHVRTSGTVHFW